MKHFMCRHIFHSEETKEIFFKAHFGKNSWDWFSATNDEENVKCASTRIGEHDISFCHWTANSEDLIHKKLEDLKGDTLFYTLAQEMKSFIAHTAPDEDFITEPY